MSKKQKHLGIFLNYTNSNLKLQITKNNYDKLESNFDFIIIDDIENNEYSDEFQKHINYKTKTNIITKLNPTINNNTEHDFDASRILKILNYDTTLNNNKIEYDKYDYITFINDNYIYCNSLNDYFKYVTDHKCDFYSYSDSSENQYHYQLYLFTFHTKILTNFINLLTKKNNLSYKLHTHIDKKMVYLKIAYLEDNLFKNIFFNDEFYEYLVKTDSLKIININKLNSITYQEFSNYLLPVYLRNLLKECGLLNYYDVPDNFNLYRYKKNYADLEKLNNKELLLHWVNNGSKERRTYT